jgi:hypothetical protein
MRCEKIVESKLGELQRSLTTGFNKTICSEAGIDIQLL